MSATFGINLEVWDASASDPEFVEVKQLTDCVPPDIEADDPIDETNHNTPDGVREFTPAETKTWTECTAEMNDRPADPGQLIIAGNIGVLMAFQVTKVGDPSNPIQFWAIIKSFKQGANPVSGKASRSLVLKPTGAAAMPS